MRTFCSIAWIGFLMLAGCRPARGGWRVSEVVNAPDGTAVLRLADGRRVPTRLYDVSFLGQIEVRGRAPYFVLGGRGCTDCDANLGLYFYSPGDGPMKGEAEQEPYPFPGLVDEWEPEAPGDTIASRSRFFLGSCLPRVGARAIWFSEERTAPATLTPRVTFLHAADGKLQRAELAPPVGGPAFAGLDEVLANVRSGTCREIPGISQPRAP